MHVTNKFNTGRCVANRKRRVNLHYTKILFNNKRKTKNEKEWFMKQEVSI